ncbi:MAG: ABC transporter permease [Micrococcales bacterium]
MLAFIGKRLASGALLLVVIGSLTYFLLNFSSSGVARNILGDSATEDQIVAKNQELGLDQPLLTRFFDWASHAIRGDLGVSWFTNQPIFDALSSRLPVTLTLVITAILIAAILATVLGMAAAVKGGWVDRLVQFLAIAGFAVPGFVVAVAFVTIFAVNLALLPATGWVPLEQDPGLWALSLVLPVGSLVIATVASAAQQIRSAFKDVLSRDWVRTLRSRGIKNSEILFKHVLRSAAPSGLTVLSLQFVGMLGGSVIIESIFALPGIGQLAVQSTAQGDTPVVMGVVLYTVIVVILVNLAVDLINGWLNPKVRV